MIDESRRKIFKSLAGRSVRISPPYFGGEYDCAQCPAPCVSECHREVLGLDEQGVYFNALGAGCDFCTQCALECEKLGKSVLNIKNPAKIVAKTEIKVSSCLAWNGVICYSCLDACRYKAIDYLGMFRPSINERCVNCAECVSACVNGSVSLS